MGDGQYEVASCQADHRRKRTPQAAPAIHDLATGVEQCEVDAAGYADDECGVRVADSDAHRPERKDDRSARPHGADECGAGAELSEHGTIVVDRAEQAVGFAGNQGLALAHPLSVQASHGLYRPESRRGVANGDQDERRGQAGDDVNPESGFHSAEQLNGTRGGDWADEVTEAENAAQARERPGAVAGRHETGHEGVAGEREDGGGETDQENAEPEGDRVRRQQADHQPDDAEQGCADHRRAFPDAAHQPSARNVSDKFPDHQDASDEPRDGQGRAEVVGENRDDRDDRALADREQQGWQQGGKRDRAPAKGWVGCTRHGSTLWSGSDRSRPTLRIGRR